MGMVRAKKDVYLGEHGYHAAGTEFEYSGPDNENLESVEVGPYGSYGDAQLRDEIRRRGLIYVAVATRKELEAVLLEDDNKPEAAKVEPKAKTPKQAPRGKDEPSGEQDGSGSEKYGAGDWTQAGRDASGFPVEKGSAEDVS